MATLVKKVSPEVLRWARETAHMDVFDIPKSVIVPEKLIRIEEGKEFPTLSQLQRLAKKYDRSLITLLGDSVPDRDYIKLPFFRKNNKINYDSALALFIRDIQRKQDWARNYLLSEGYEVLEFIRSVKLANDPEKTAKKIKERLDLPTFANYKNNDEYFKSIKSNLESNNIFVSITGSNKSNKSISLEESQGFAIADEFAPFIFVNTKNTTNAKIFTIIHEVVHLFLGESGISEDAIKFRKPQCKEDRIENFCNIVASEILMPKEVFVKKFEDSKSPNLRELVTHLSKYFLVSELAICVRLWKLKLINYSTYEMTYSEIKEEIDKYLEKMAKKMKDSDGGNYYANMLSKNGNLLSQLAFFAYKENKILGTDLYDVLNVKLDNLNTYFSAV